MDVYPDGGELVWRRAFPGLPEQARQAREFVAFLLTDLPSLDDVLFVTGELVANALRHTASAGPEGRFLLEVRRRHKNATIALTDQGALTEPVIPDIDDFAESGRGLLAARALTTEFTWFGDDDGRTFSATFSGEAP